MYHTAIHHHTSAITDSYYKRARNAITDSYYKRARSAITDLYYKRARSAINTTHAPLYYTLAIAYLLLIY